MTEKMQEYCRALLQKYETGKAQLLDLYGGVGTFGIINAEVFQRVTIVESVPSSIQAAKQNIHANNVSNATAVLLDAKQLKKVQLAAPLFVITDPPRTGMDRKTIEQLNFLKPKVIVYISCNIQQTEKEIKQFKEYEIKSVALFDFFPQTPHSETVIELARKEVS
jgi:23S rRNA (uracil1939-C5)-methyltransferase